jgi:hypothetical protein
MKNVAMIAEQIAPCGANCILCMAYLRSRNRCLGCRFGDEGKAKSCAQCIIKNCREIADNGYAYCFECSKYPCKRLVDLDKRYRNSYSYSMLASLDEIKRIGIRRFLKKATDDWTCPACGGIVCVHRGYCSECGAVRYVNIANKRPPLK